jgi:hypothetical protein
MIKLNQPINLKQFSLKKKRSQIASKQNKHGAALQKVKVAFAWKIWLLSLFLNGKAFTKVVLHPKLRSRTIFLIMHKLNNKSCLNDVAKNVL